MTYKKPELMLIGNAMRVLQTPCTQKNDGTADGAGCKKLHGPAYDLDE